MTSAWYESTRRGHECAVCGEVVDDMSLHRGTVRCRTEGERRSQIAKGNVLCGNYWQVLRSAGVAVKVRTGYKVSQDAARWPDQVREQWWAPAWAFSIASAHFLKNNSRDFERPADQSFHLWLDQAPNRRALIERTKSDLEFQEALLYAHGQKHDPHPLLRAYAREKGLYRGPGTDN